MQLKRKIQEKEKFKKNKNSRKTKIQEKQKFKKAVVKNYFITLIFY
jgi:hypothetical protein